MLILGRSACQVRSDPGPSCPFARLAMLPSSASSRVGPTLEEGRFEHGPSPDGNGGIRLHAGHELTLATHPCRALELEQPPAREVLARFLPHHRPLAAQGVA